MRHENEAQVQEMSPAEAAERWCALAASGRADQRQRMEAEALQRAQVPAWRQREHEQEVAAALKELDARKIEREAWRAVLLEYYPSLPLTRCGQQDDSERSRMDRSRAPELDRPGSGDREQRVQERGFSR